VPEAEPSLPRKIDGLRDAFAPAGIDHAFGGALALAYSTLELRATADVGVNVSVDSSEAGRVLQTMPDGVAWTATDLRRLGADEQVRVWWGRTPVDLFLRADAFHDGVANRAVWHPFGDARCPSSATTTTGGGGCVP
jgi:hypothetical protein